MVEQGNRGNNDIWQNMLNAVMRTGVNRDFPISGFVADSAMMDELRLEWSAVSPELNNGLTDLGIEILDKLETMYGEFIPEETLEQSAGIVDRILCIAPDRYQDFIDSWYPDKPKREGKSQGTFHPKYGRIVAFQHPAEILKSVDSALTEEQMEEAGGRKNVYKNLLLMYFPNVLSHEIIHEYFAASYSLPFNESGTEYYTQQLHTQNGLPYGYLVGYGDKPKAFYAELVEKYGDDVHRTFFGSPVSYQTRRQITREFTPEKVKELFPMWQDEL
jgi:hypothetical protein